MYTNIPPTEGIQAIKAFVASDHSNKVVHIFTSLLHFVLENNYFTFGGKTYQQTNGTAMGTAVSVVYANLFCAAPEWELLGKGFFPCYYRRFINNIFAVVVGTESTVQTFCMRFGALHPSLTVNWVVDNACTSFLDVTVQLRLNEGSMKARRGTTFTQKCTRNP
jgi:hypothetical protein